MSAALDAVRRLFQESEAVPPMPELGRPAPQEQSYAEPKGDDAPRPPEAVAAAFPLNDIGNGQRFVTYFGADVIRVSRVGWYIWKDTRWLSDEEDQRGYSPLVRELAQRVSARILEEIPYIVLEPWEQRLLDEAEEAEAEERRLKEIDDHGEDERKALLRVRRKLDSIAGIRKRLGTRRRDHRSHSKNTGNSGKIEAMLKEAAVQLFRPLDALDARALDVNCASGVMRFAVTPASEGMSRTADVRLVDHDRSQLITKMMPVEYQPGASRKRFDAFLRRIQPDPEMRAFLARWFGLSMTALTGDQKLAFFYGHGANGKSVLVDLMARMLGDYATVAKIESLTGTNRRGGGDATPDLIPLMGARLVRASEPEQGTRLQEGVIKEITGGEPLLVRALHSDFVEVTPRFKLTISGNHKPEIRGTDDGIWRRVLLTPFEVQIPEAERDPDLIEKLWKERSGILDWMVDGLLDYLEGGLQVPEKILAATRSYREESDPMQLFLDQCCEVTGSETEFTRSKDLVEAFNFWLEEKGETRWTGRTVALRLKDKAERWRDPRTGLTFTAAKRSVSGYLGLRLSDMFRQRMHDATSAGSGWSGGGHGDTSPDPF